MDGLTDGMMDQAHSYIARFHYCGPNSFFWTQFCCSGAGNNNHGLFHLFLKWHLTITLYLLYGIGVSASIKAWYTVSLSSLASLARPPFHMGPAA